MYGLPIFIKNRKSFMRSSEYTRTYSKSVRKDSKTVYQRRKRKELYSQFRAPYWWLQDIAKMGILHSLEINHLYSSTYSTSQEWKSSYGVKGKERKILKANFHSDNSQIIGQSIQKASSQKEQPFKKYSEIFEWIIKCGS